MEWIIGIYIAVGVVKTIGRMGNPNPGLRPAWFVLERGALTLAIYFTLNVLAWPFARA